MHNVDRGPIGGGEGKVHLAGRTVRRRRREPQVREALRAGQPDNDAVRAGIAHRLADAERSEDRGVEGGRGVDVGDLQRKVVEHRSR